LQWVEGGGSERECKRLPEGDDWAYELKFDGYRALIIKDGQQVELRSRKDKNLAGMYRGIAAAGRRLKADQAVVDGEIVALDAQGSPSFQALQHCFPSSGNSPVRRIREIRN
jgi:bifunctional non-homologous end joining protein LigD